MHPLTPTKSATGLDLNHHNTFRSVRFDLSTSRDDSEESELPAVAPTSATSSKPLYFLYTHQRTRTAFYKKWQLLQDREKARMLSGERETSMERQHREYLESLKKLVEQAEEHIKERKRRATSGSTTKSSNKRNAEAMEGTQESPMKKQRFAFEQQRTTAPPGFEQPIPGEDGYHMSTQLPPANANNWVPESVRPMPLSGKNDAHGSSQIFGTSPTVPGAALESISTSQILNQRERPTSRGRTFGVPSDEEDDAAFAPFATMLQDDSLVSQKPGKTYGLNYDDFSESDDDSMQDSAPEFAEEWEGKPFNQWTKSTMAAFKEAPLPAGVAPTERSLSKAITSILAGDCPEPLHAGINSHPRIAELGMSPNDYLTVSYPDNRGAVTYTRQDYYHWMVKPPGTEHMSSSQRATWKCMQEFKNWRKFSEVVRLYQQDETPALVAKIDGRLQEVEKKRKRIEDEEQAIEQKEQELERRNKILADNVEKLGRLREEQLRKQKTVAAMSKPSAPKQTGFSSIMASIEEPSQTAQPSLPIQQVAARVPVPSKSAAPSKSASKTPSKSASKTPSKSALKTGQPPAWSIAAPPVKPSSSSGLDDSHDMEGPSPFGYDGCCDIETPSSFNYEEYCDFEKATQLGAPASDFEEATQSGATSAPTWTQSPPPAPTPAHAKLPPQAKTAPVPAVQPPNKYAPKKPSRLRESTTYSPGPLVQKSIEKNGDGRSIILQSIVSECQQIASLFGPGRLTPPAEVESGALENAIMEDFSPSTLGEPGCFSTLYLSNHR
jgi:hypothetical protein